MPLLVLLTFTFVALLAGLLVGVFFNRAAVERRVDAEVAELFAEVETMPTYFRADELDGLPPPVVRFFRRNLIEGQPHPSCVRVRQHGESRDAPGQPWVEFVGEGYAVSGRPALLEFTRARPYPLVWVDHRLLYLRGRGQRTAKWMSSLTTVDTGDDATRRATLLRYLSELVLLPPALLAGDNLRWEPVDDAHARAILRDGELEVRATFEFDELGNAVGFVADERPRGSSGEAARWTVRYAEHRSFGELQLPTRIEGQWQLGEVAFPHLRRTVDAVEVDVPRRWGATSSSRPTAEPEQGPDDPQA